jgi:NAD(P)-dependent dehydrogenase (short-subunit alcohol dehydrogenase family)
MGRLEGKVAVITGAASGIGRAAAQRFAIEGALVTAVDLSYVALKPLGEEIGEKHLCLAADVSDEDAVREAFSAVQRRFGRLDVLYNCAGVQLLEEDAPVDQLDLQAWTRTLAVNLTGVYLCSKHAVPQMLEQGSGSIINCGSPTGLTGRGWRYHAYSASKGGVMALSRAMAAAYGPRGVRVNCIVPGTIVTGMTNEIAANPARAGELVSRTVLGRLGQPEDVSGMAVYLASDESAYATGGTFVVDGGLTIT